MKKVMVVVGVLVVVGGIAAMGQQPFDSTARAPWGGNVGPVARLVLPAPGAMQTNCVQWYTASNAAVTLDQIINVESQRYYQVTITGTCVSGAAPSHTWGEATNGTAMLRYIHPGLRTSLRLSNMGTGLVYVAYKNAAMTNRGGVMLANTNAAWNFWDGKYPGNVWAISGGSGTNWVLAHEE